MSGRVEITYLSYEQILGRTREIIHSNFSKNKYDLHVMMTYQVKQQYQNTSTVSHLRCSAKYKNKS